MPARRCARRSVLVAVFVALVGAALPSTSLAVDRVLADSGFRPAPNGFAFPNYGSGRADLSAAEMRRLFGNGVCTSRRRGLCVLAPPASEYLNEVNQDVQGGHCYGFSVLALGQFKHQFAPLGVGLPFSYVLEGNIALQRSLAYTWAFQTLDSVNRGQIKGTPNQVLQAIERVLNDRGRETYTIGIFRADGSGGHALTPFEVVDHDAGVVGVRVYDNNYPGETREISFDTNANTSRYNAATNPMATTALYEGTAAKPGLELDPTTPGLGVQPCPFCEKSARRPGRGEATIRLIGDRRDHAHLLIRNGRGQRVGLLNGRLINEIPGARVEPVLADDTTLRLEPTYVVPERPATITIDGRRLRHVDTETVDSIGPGHDVSLRDLRLAPGQRDLLRVAAGGVRRMSLSTARGQRGSPTVQIGTDGTRADDSLSLRLVRFRGGATLHLALDPRRRVLTVSVSARRGSQAVVLTVVRRPHNGGRTAGHLMLHLRGARRDVLNYSRLPKITAS